MMALLETVKRIATQSGYHLLSDPSKIEGAYTLKRVEVDFPVAIFQSLDEVIVYLMAHNHSNKVA